MNINILSILIVLIFIVFMVIGYRRGIIRTVIGTAAIIIAFFLSYFLAPLASRIIIDNTKIDEYIDAKIYEKIENEVRERAEEAIRQELKNLYGDASFQMEIPEIQIDQAVNERLSKSQQIEVIGNLPLPDYVREALVDNNNSEIYNRLQVSDFYHYISKYIAYMAVNIISFIFLFVILRLVLMVFSILLNTIGELPIISGVNHIGGLILGAVMALFVSWLVLIILSALSGINSSTVVDNMIAESRMLTVLNEKNLVKNAITNITDILF